MLVVPWRLAVSAVSTAAVVYLLVRSRKSAPRHRRPRRVYVMRHGDGVAESVRYSYGRIESNAADLNTLLGEVLRLNDNGEIEGKVERRRG